jgi:hypothetical protein
MGNWRRLTDPPLLYIMADMDVDVDVPAVASKKDDSKKRFEVKKVCTVLDKLGFVIFIHQHTVECGGLVGMG